MFVLVAVTALVFLLACLLNDCHPYPTAQRDMRRHISDAEFLAACGTSNPEIALTVRAIISDQLDIPLDNIHPSDRFVEELGCD